MTFDTRDINRSNLNLKDIQQVTKADSSYNSGDVQVTESRLYGTPKTSFENVGSARIRIIHTESINPEIRGSRARHINAIYIENAQGERFRMDHNKLSGARAMARHISEGGRPWDDIGGQINVMVQEMNELGTFVRGMRRRTFEDATTQTMLEASISYYNNMHRQLNALRGIKTYKSFVENFQPQPQQLDEVDVNGLKERFVKKIFDDRMVAALPHVYKAYKLQEQNKQKQLITVRSIIEGHTALTLAINDGMDEYMKMLRFNDTSTLVKKVLEDIAARAVTIPEVATFANYWANNYDTILETEENKLRFSCNDFFNIDKWQINEPIMLKDLYILLDKVEGVQTVKNIVIINKTGSTLGYSNYAYDVTGATINNVIYPSIDPMIFEVKNLDTDIKGRVVPM